MKLACVVLALVGAFIQPDAVIKSEDLVEDFQTIIYEDELYVALISKPIFTLSERAELCDRIKSNIYSKCGIKAQVIIDMSLYFDIKHAKSLDSQQRNDFIKKKIKPVFLRRNYDYSRYIATQEKGA